MRRLIALAALLALTVATGSAQAASSKPVEEYQQSWIHRALELQYDLGGDAPFRNSHWVGTHNSFNSRAEMGPALSAFDSNQKLRLVEQLRIDVRSLELDVHWFFRPRLGGFAPVVCHATPQHAGCTTEKTLGPVLDEIGGWLRRPANEDEVLLLYLEDHLDNQVGYDTAAGIVEEKLGNLLYEPPGNGCTSLPLDLTRDAVRAAGEQVVVVSDCGIGSEWPSVAFNWADAHLEKRPFDYTDFPACAPQDFSRAEYQGTLIRYFEDSTKLTGTVGTPDDGITPRTAAQMSRCGVDLFGLDQLLPFDGRLQSLVWSWAPGQPREGGRECAVQRVDAVWPFGRWFARPCGLRQPVACRDGADWLVFKAPVRAANAEAACAVIGAEHAVPRTGYETQLVRLAMRAEGVSSAWLGYRLQGGEWVALDQR